MVWQKQLRLQRNHQVPNQLFISRVCVCGGWAVHGIILEHNDGTRSGVLLSNGNEPLGIYNDHVIRMRYGHFVNVEKEGDYIVQVTGYNTKDDCRPSYLCHSLQIRFASGQEIGFSSHHHPWKGKPFDYRVEVDAPLFINEIWLQDGQCLGLRGVRTALHLPITEKNANYLPADYKRKLLFLIQIAVLKDKELQAKGSKTIGCDAWWGSILCYMKGHELL